MTNTQGLIERLIQLAADVRHPTKLVGSSTGAETIEEAATAISELVYALHNADLQLEYLDEKFQKASTTVGVRNQIAPILNKYSTPSIK